MLIFGVHTGGGFVNSLINNLPFELHLPRYQFCGPGTKLSKRLARGDRGINKLDSSCRKHDIAYSQNSSLADRHKADFELENRAWERVKAKDSDLGEKTAAWLVTNTMKAKRKLGMGKKLSFKQYVVQPTSKVLKKSTLPLNDQKMLKKNFLFALRAAKAVVKKAGGKKQVRVPRIIPFESKSGGFLPLLPILAGLGAIGTLAGGASTFAKNLIDIKDKMKNINGKNMVEVGKKGSGLYLRKSPRGYGLYLKKEQKNSQ